MFLLFFVEFNAVVLGISTGIPKSFSDKKRIKHLSFNEIIYCIVIAIHKSHLPLFFMDSDAASNFVYMYMLVYKKKKKSSGR